MSGLIGVEAFLSQSSGSTTACPPGTKNDLSAFTYPPTINGNGNPKWSFSVCLFVSILSNNKQGSIYCCAGISKNISFFFLN